LLRRKGGGKIPKENQSKKRAGTWGGPYEALILALGFTSLHGKIKVLVGINHSGVGNQRVGGALGGEP